MTRFVVQGYGELMRHASGQDKTMGPMIAAFGKPRSLKGGVDCTMVDVKASIDFLEDTFEVEVSGSLDKALGASCSACGSSISPNICRHALAALCLAWDRRGDGGLPAYAFDLNADSKILSITCDVSCSYKGHEYGSEIFGLAYGSIPQAAEVYDVLCGELGFQDGPDGFSLQYGPENALMVRRVIYNGFKPLARFGEVHLTESMIRIGLIDHPKIRVHLGVKDGVFLLRITSPHMDGRALAGFLRLATVYRLWGMYASSDSHRMLVLRDHDSKSLAVYLDLLGVSPDDAAAGARLPLAMAFRAAAALDSGLCEGLDVERSSLDAFLDTSKENAEAAAL